MTWQFWLFVMVVLFVVGGLLGFVLGYPRRPLR
jgi:hypothetical protein